MQRDKAFSFGAFLLVRLGMPGSWLLSAKVTYTPAMRSSAESQNQPGGGKEKKENGPIFFDVSTKAAQLRSTQLQLSRGRSHPVTMKLFALAPEILGGSGFLVIIFNASGDLVLSRQDRRR